VIGVVHLVWGPLGAMPLQRFLDSYRTHPAGTDHELVIIWNGTTVDQRAELEPLLDGVPHQALIPPEPVQDLAAYRSAADLLTHDRLCFLNSHSAIASEHWLAKLDGGLVADGPGIVGASGSWMSIRSAYAYLLGWPGAYRGALPSRRAVFGEMRRMNAELLEERGVTVPAPLRRRLELAYGRMLASPGFPVPHIRTNGFLLRRELFGRLVASQPRDKLDAYGLEAGPRSLTAQVLAAGGEARVIDSAGDAYGVDAWGDSATFWQAGQERLMLEDNQTRIYTRGDELRRRVLSGWAWGRP
jgi:hypothetical protein